MFNCGLIAVLSYGQLAPFSTRLAAVTVPVSAAAPSRIESVHVPLIWALVSPANAAVRLVTGAGLVCPVPPAAVVR